MSVVRVLRPLSESMHVLLPAQTRIDAQKTSINNEICNDIYLYMACLIFNRQAKTNTRMYTSIWINRNFHLIVSRVIANYSLQCKVTIWDASERLNVSWTFFFFSFILCCLVLFIFTRNVVAICVLFRTKPGNKIQNKKKQKNTVVEEYFTRKYIRALLACFAKRKNTDSLCPRTTDRYPKCRLAGLRARMCKKKPTIIWRECQPHTGLVYSNFVESQSHKMKKTLFFQTSQKSKNQEFFFFMSLVLLSLFHDDQ